MKTFFAAALLIGGLSISSAQAEGFPKHLESGEAALSAWLSKLKTKTRAEVESELGPATEVTTWSFKGSNQLKLLYISATSAGKRRVEVLFHGERVIVTSYQLLP